MNTVRKPPRTSVPTQSRPEPAPPRTRASLAWGVLPVLLAAVLVAFLHLSSDHALRVYEPPWLLPILNMVFISLTSCLVAYLALRSYLVSGSPTVLLLGSGALTLGAGACAAGWLIGPAGPNATVTVFNTAFLAAAVFHAAGTLVGSRRASPEANPVRRRQRLAIAYLGGLAFIAVLTVAASLRMTPQFFVQGIGPTLLRQVILGLALALFGLTAHHLLVRSRREQAPFLYWYGLALVLLAVMAVGVLLQRAVGSPLGWAARSAQYLAGLYFLIAVVAASREAHTRGLTLDEAVARLLSHPGVYWEDLLATVGEAIVSCDGQGRIVQWNRAAERIFGYTQAETLGRGLELVLPAGQATDVSRLAGPREDATIEMELLRRGGAAFPGEASVSSVRLPVGDLTTLVIRDITERKQAERERERLQAELLSAEQARAELAETLNRETSHRVKNNLSMIAGLLQIQMAEQQNPEVTAVLRDTTARIMAFAGLHEQLQRTAGEEADLLGIVRHVADTTASVFAFHRVSIHVEGETALYPRRVATNLAVLVHELITNAIKHGAPGPDGRFSVEVRLRQAAGALHISVRNSGPPLPPDFDPARQHGLGLRLVRGLAAEQYRGTFRLTPEAGGTLAEIVLEQSTLR